MNSPVQEKKSENFLVSMFDTLTSKVSSLNSRSVVIVDSSCPQTSMKAGNFTNEVVWELVKTVAKVVIVAAAALGVFVAGIVSTFASGSPLVGAITIVVGSAAIALAVEFFSKQPES